MTPLLTLPHRPRRYVVREGRTLLTAHQAAATRYKALAVLIAAWRWLFTPHSVYVTCEDSR